MIFISVLFPNILSAQQYGHNLSDKIEKAHRSGIVFQELNLFSEMPSTPQQYVTKYTALKPNTDNIARLYSDKPTAVSYEIHTATGKVYTLEMTQSHPASPDAQIGYIDAEGRHMANYDAGLHYQGAIKGYQKSVAAMSVFANGEVMILFSNDDGNYVLGKMNDNSGLYSLYNTKDRLERIPFHCETDKKDFNPGSASSANKTTGAIMCKKLRLYWECDYNLYQLKGSLSATQLYVLSIFNFVQTIYYNDGIAIEMSSLYIWTVPDPYMKTGAFDALYHFAAYWSSQNHSFYGDQASLLTELTGSQGYAYLDGLCNNVAYASNNLYGQPFATFPAFDIDIYLLAHETGHNIGAVHSHSCSWNTGPGGTCGSIDNCTIQEGGSNCATCPSTDSISKTGWSGTVMSYCSTLINFSAGFGPVISAYLRNKINSKACLQPVISTDLIVQNICNSDGAITLSYKPNNFGVAPYNYVWSSGQTTKDLNGLSAAGKYIVTIIDSNNCSVKDTAEVIELAKPGDGQPVQGTMPLCCMDTSFKVIIKSFLPSKITNCQTISWLRTSAPVTSYADAKTAYQNATTADILPSDNELTVSNSVAAELTIKSPDSCNTTSVHYYTPYISRKPKAKNIYTATAINPVPIKHYSIYTLGTSYTIPAQTGVPSGCEKAGVPVHDTITVTVSNYTGRANKLAIRIVGVDKQELFRKIDYPGDGTYKIPVITDNHFQEMAVKVFDFNCKRYDSCISCSMNVSALREVTFDSLASGIMDESCTTGTSVLVSFGPDNCNLGISGYGKPIHNIALHPNPATNNTVLEFYAAKKGDGSIRLNDATGKLIQEETIHYIAGSNRYTIPLSGLAQGIYFVALKVNNESTYNMKLQVR
ncbi:MAG: zinc-dependent metalloprotease [Bacteroidetes bacterium]|nr:zinc-dependent metalloprotease [Bacteroidota bacterium]